MSWRRNSLSLVKPTTLAEYAELRLWLDSLREAKKLSEWGEAMRWYALNDLFFMVNEIISDGRNMHSEYGTPFYWHERYVQYCRDVEWQAEHGGGIDSSGRGSGKALALDTPVLTPSGWKSHGDLRPGDLVYGSDGLTCSVEAVSPVWIGDCCYRISFDDGTSVVANSDHMWSVFSPFTSRYETLTTGELATSRLRWKGSAWRYRIQSCLPVNPDSSPDLPVGPYTLGAWLGDGQAMAGSVCGVDIVGVDPVESVPTSCIEVSSPNNLYLVGRGLVPTHNSTIRTKSFSIQQILKHPDLAICIFSFTKDAAKKHFTTIMEELSRNKLLYALFPEVLYENPLEAAMNSETTWSKTDGLTVKRNIIRAQPTLSYRPYVGGTPTGGRFDILHVDDAEDDKVVSSKIFLEKLHSTYDATIPVLTPVALQVPVLFVTNTVYAENGLVKRLINRMKADGEDPRKCICYKAEDLTKDGDGPLGGEPLYPYTAKILKKFYDEPREKEMYGLQFLGDPIVTSQRTLSRDWLKSYPGDPQDWGRNKSIYICIDPSKGVEDPMAIWVWALGEDKKFSWVDGSLKKLDPAHRAFWDEIYLIARSWSDLGRLVEIRMEQYGQATYVEQLDAEMKKRGFYVPIVKVQNIKNQWSQKLSAWSGKYDRIYSRWAPPCQRGEVLIPTPVADGGPGMVRQDEKGKSLDLVEEFLYKEWLKFPKPISDNMLDAGSLIWENEGKDSKGNKIRRELQFPSVQRGKAKSRRRYSGTSFMSAG